jgi:cytochrome c-type biogenesis protein CcmH
VNGTVARRWAPWLLLSALLVVALALGARSSNGPRTQAQRVQHIAAQLRCPVCEGQTVADSDALISRDIRTVIQQKVAAGQSDRQIVSLIVRQYPGTLLTPPATGVGMIVWALPVLAFVAALGGLWLAFARWRSRPGVTVTEADRALVEQALRG